MTFWDTLRADMVAMKIEKTNGLTMLKSFFMRLDFIAVFLFRVSSHFSKGGYLSRGFSFFIWRMNVLLNSCDIRPQAEIGPGFSLPHPMGVIIGRIKAGKNFQVHQNVTLGRGKSTDPNDGGNCRPTVGDDVTIYAGAVLAGGIAIGDGAKIGANSAVFRDVRAGYTVFPPQPIYMPPGL